MAGSNSQVLQSAHPVNQKGVRLMQNELLEDQNFILEHWLIHSQEASCFQHLEFWSKKIGKNAIWFAELAQLISSCFGKVKTVFGGHVLEAKLLA